MPYCGGNSTPATQSSCGPLVEGHLRAIRKPKLGPRCPEPCSGPRVDSIYLELTDGAIGLPIPLPLFGMTPDQEPVSHLPPQRGLRRLSRVGITWVALLSGLVLGSLNPFPVAGQANRAAPLVSIRIKVVDNVTGDPLPGALIEFPGIGFATVADETGGAHAEEVALGEYLIRVSCLGYNPSEGMMVLSLIHI